MSTLAKETIYLKGPVAVNQTVELLDYMTVTRSRLKATSLSTAQTSNMT